MEAIKVKRVRVSLTDSNLKKRQTELKVMAKTGNRDAGTKIQRITDAGHKGLSIEIRPDGGMSWRFCYVYNRKPNMLSLGTFPEIGLSEARKRADLARVNVAIRKDPSRLKKAERSEKFDTFEKVVLEWHRVNPKKHDPKNSKEILRHLELDILPFIGDMPISDITTADLYTTIMRVWKRGAKESAYRLSGWCKHIF